MKATASKRYQPKGGAGVPKRARSGERRSAPASKSRAIIKAQPVSLAEAIEKVLITGDLTPLTPEQRLDYYRAVCKSLGLNPLTRPFDYIVFREAEGGPGRLALYARKDCTEQLRKLYGVGVKSLKREISDDLCIVEAIVQDRNGKPDAGTGVVALYKYKDGKTVKLTGKELCNAIMKAETKAKRRATLSICGLGFLDESEIETVENYSMVTPGGRIIEEQTGSREAAKAVASEKIKELQEKLNPPAAKPTLFCFFPEEFNGHYAFIEGDGDLKAKYGPFILEDCKGKLSEKTGKFRIPVEEVDKLKYCVEQAGDQFQQVKAAS